MNQWPKYKLETGNPRPKSGLITADLTTSCI